MNNQDSIRDDGRPNKYFHVILNMADDDLNPYQYRLLGHYRRVCGDDGMCWEGTRTTATKCKMSIGMVSKTRKELEQCGYIAIETKENETFHITVIDRWIENVARYATRSHGERGVHVVNTTVHTVNEGVHVVKQRITHEEKHPKNNQEEIKTPLPPKGGTSDKKQSPPTLTGKVSAKRKKADAYCESCKEGIEALISAARIAVPAALLTDKDLYLLIEVYEGTIRYSIPLDKFDGLYQFTKNTRHWDKTYTPTLRDINNNLLPYSTYLNAHQPPPPAAPMDTVPDGFDEPDGTVASPEEMDEMQRIWNNLLDKTKHKSVMGDEVRR